MATQYLKLEGTISWADSQYGGLFSPDPKYPNYKAQVYLTPDSWDKFKKAGIRLESKTDDNGDYVIFKRPTEKIIKGKLEKFGPPKVFFAPGITPTRAIGNGSKVEVEVQVYGSEKGKGHRLDAVSVLELVTYEGTGGSRREGFIELTEDTPAEVGGEDVEAEYDDEIPFGTPEESPPPKRAPEGDKVEEKKPAAKKTPFRR